MVWSDNLGYDQPDRTLRSVLGTGQRRELDRYCKHMPTEGDSMPRKRAHTADSDLHEPEVHGEATHHEEGAVEYTHGGADDALGLYLKQMGAIPLLSREKELALAIRLETARSRYRHAVLFSWWTIRRVVEIFERIQAGDSPIDPQIDT